MNMASHLADRVTSAVLFVLGAAMLAGGYSMDRLEIRQIHPASIPGLLPMFLGGALLLCALMLYISVRPSAVAKASETSGEMEQGSTRDLLVSAALSLGFAAILVGRVPFVVASAIYISSFVAYFAWPNDGSARQKIKIAGLSLFAGIAVASAVSALFRYGFLVRLP